MSASLVGSEMCIRDRLLAHARARLEVGAHVGDPQNSTPTETARWQRCCCLLYTSDAADDM
eukprot:10824898-Alexandrium_andersonii.AAC.1